MNYLQTKIRVFFAVDESYLPGDYCRLHSTADDTAIDYSTPINNVAYPMFGKDGDSGVFGFGHGMFGNHQFGTIDGRNIGGFGRVKFGNTDFGRGAAFVTVIDTVTAPGKYNYGFSAYDEAGNSHSGTPDEESIYACVQPKKPTALKRSSYTDGTTTLVLTV